MAKEVVTYAWCDVCLDKYDKRVEGTEIGPLLLPGMRQPKSVDLCQDHYVTLFAELMTVVEAHGKSLSAQASAAIPKRVPGSKADTKDGSVFLCKVPDCTGYKARTDGFRSRDKLRGHVSKQHGLNLMEYQERYGVIKAEAPDPQQPALSMETEQREEQQPPLECEVCHKVYPSGKYMRPRQALAVHRSRSHGIRSQKFVAQQEARAAG